MTTTNADHSLYSSITTQLKELRGWCARLDYGKIIDKLLQIAIEHSKNAPLNAHSRSSLLELICQLYRMETATLPGDSNTILVTGRVLADIYRSMGDFYEAEMLTRREAYQRPSTLYRIACDIKAQKNPARNRELAEVYCRAVRVWHEGPHLSAWTKTREIEIANIYVGLIEVRLALGELEEARKEIDNLLIVSERSIRQTSDDPGVPLQLLEGMKSSLKISLAYLAKGKMQEAVQQLLKAGQISALVVMLKPQSDVEERVQGAWHDTLQQWATYRNKGARS